MRFCVNYTKLNAVTTKDVYPLTRVDDALHSLGNAKFFSTMDLTSSYWQIELDDESKPKSAFVCRRGLFELVRMLFGEISSCPKRLPVRLPNTLQAARFEVDDFQKAQDLESAYALWQSVWGETWPLSFSHFSKVLVQMKQPAHFVVRDGQRIIGFAATQQVENEGQLALLMVHPDYRRQGIGSRLNDHCMALFRQRGTQRVQLGATYPRFFCGLPNEDELDFFKRRGYIFGNKVWDLMGDLSGYEMPTDIITRMEKEGIRFETLKDQKECADLMTFE
nr:GNAT family N-acetyltransferase [Proteus mirabilis]